MQQDSSAQPRYETLVVVKEQLNNENLRMLAEQGWTIITDPSLLIFARPARAQSEDIAQPNHSRGHGRDDEEMILEDMGPRLRR